MEIRKKKYPESNFTKGDKSYLMYQNSAQPAFISSLTYLVFCPNKRNINGESSPLS